MKLRVEKDPTYYIKWRVVRPDGSMERRFKTKKLAKMYIKMREGDLKVARAFYREVIRRAKKAGLSDAEAWRSAVLSVQHLGGPDVFRTHPETGQPLEELEGETP